MQSPIAAFIQLRIFKMQEIKCMHSAQTLRGLLSAFFSPGDMTTRCQWQELEAPT